MHIFSRNVVMGVVLALAMPLTAFSESAPVYDADSLPQQFYNAPDQNEPDVPPPAPEQQQQQEDAFVPAQTFPTVSANPANTVPTPPKSSEQRLRRVEQQVNEIQSMDVAVRTESLQKQVQSLRNQIEQLTHQMQQMQAQQKSFSDQRLSQQADEAPLTEEIAAPVKPKPPKKTSSVKSSDKKIAAPPVKEVSVGAVKEGGDNQPNGAEEQQIYQTAYNLIKSKKYNEAVNALQKMLQKYPSGQFASNAHYWLGELYGLLGKNDQALSEFSTVVKSYPDSPRLSDAELKVGLIYAAEGKWPEAKTGFKKVINRYPGSSSARLAAEQLKQIKQAGH